MAAVLERTNSRVYLLKPACEGAEYQILKCLTPDLRVMMEPTPQLYDIADVSEHLQALGYPRQWRSGLYLFCRS
jgi:hypothetical protein